MMISQLKNVFVLQVLCGDAQRDKNFICQMLNTQERNEKSLMLDMQLMYGKVTDSDARTLYKDERIDVMYVHLKLIINGDKLYAAVYGSDTQLTVNIVRLPDIDISPSWHPNRQIKRNAFIKEKDSNPGSIKI